jgi:hypothetical protein
MVTTSPWFTSAHGDDRERAVMVAFAKGRLLDGRRPEHAFGDLVALGTDRRQAAIAVCVAAGTTWEQAEARMAGFDGMWASLAHGSAEVAGGLLELYGYFDQDVVLDDQQNATASFLQQAMAAVEFLPSGYANQMHRLLRTGQLREAFLSLEEMGDLRWQENHAFWHRMRQAAAGLDAAYPLDNEVAAARWRCDRRVPT